MTNARLWAIAAVGMMLVAVTACGQGPAVDPYSGQYEGTYTTTAGDSRKVKAVVSQDGNAWRIVVSSVEAEDKAISLNLAGRDDGNRVVVSGPATIEGVWAGTIQDDKLVVGAYKATSRRREIENAVIRVELTKIAPKSPAEGPTPPAKAVPNTDKAPSPATRPATQPTSRPTTRPTTQPKIVALDKLDPFTGEYEGTHTTSGGDTRKAKGTVYQDQEGWKGTVTSAGDREEPTSIQLVGLREGEKLALSAQVSFSKWGGTVEGDKMSVIHWYETPAGMISVDHQLMELTKVTRKSPTEGLNPPAGAVVLLPIAEQAPSLAAWKDAQWKALPGGVMEVAPGDIRTRQEFGSIKLHVEFMVPFEPAGSGQARGNSGVYLQDRYEVQILDSFGLKMAKGDCGVLYQQAVPTVNVCLPPLSWQTYDITFQAAKFDAAGKVTANPRITVVHNGVETIKDFEIKTVTGGAAGQQHVAKAPLRLQNHQHPVRFRNIWVEELP